MSAIFLWSETPSVALFRGKQQEAAVSQGDFRQSQAVGTSVPPASLLCSLADAPTSLSVRNCSWSENCLWQLSHNPSVCRKCEKIEKLCFPSERVNEKQEGCWDACGTAWRQLGQTCWRRGTSNLTELWWIYSEFSQGCGEKRRWDWGSVSGGEPVYV